MNNQYQSDLTDEHKVRSLYKKLLDSWNNNDAAAFAGLFAADATVIGFDGSQLNGSADIFNQINDVFNHHKVSAYISIVRELRAIAPGVFVLRSVAGMVPPGGHQINPSVNAVQALIAVKQNGEFKIALFQNTPAAFHGRPELSEQLTDELQQTWATANSSGSRD